MLLVTKLNLANGAWPGSQVDGVSRKVYALGEILVFKPATVTQSEFDTFVLQYHLCVGCCQFTYNSKKNVTCWLKKIVWKSLVVYLVGSNSNSAADSDARLAVHLNAARVTHALCDIGGEKIFPTISCSFLGSRFLLPVTWPRGSLTLPVFYSYRYYPDSYSFLWPVECLTSDLELRMSAISVQLQYGNNGLLKQSLPSLFNAIFTLRGKFIEQEIQDFYNYYL